MSRKLGIVPVPNSRSRQEALERRREASLVLEMARLLLKGESLAQVLPTAAARMAQALELQSAAIVMEAVEADARSVAFPLREGDRRLGTVVVGADSSERSLYRLQERVVPALEALLSAALERETLQGGVVETAALRQADVVKTALLRAVSHDLRSPLTAISTAAEAIALPGVSAPEREELASAILAETRRLSRLVDNLLDLSKLRRARRSRGGSGCRWRRCSAWRSRTSRRRRPPTTQPLHPHPINHRKRSSTSRSTVTCPWCAPTPHSWSGRS